MVDNIAYYDYIVVGLGGIGSATLYWLAKKAGKNVLGLEQFNLGHENGGSQDHSRIIRLEYPEEHYTKLTPFTYEAWAELEQESGLQVVHKTGSLLMGRKGTAGEASVIRYASAMEAQNIPFERWDGRQLRSHFPQFRCDDDVICLYQKSGGLVDAALGNALHIQMARGHGANILEHCAVNRVVTNDDDDTATVYTTKGTFRCRRLVVTAGAWTNQVLGSLGAHIPIVVTQEQVSYFATPNTRLFTKDRFPAFIYYEDNGNFDFYSMPIHGNSGFKIGMDAMGPTVTAQTRTFEPDPVREETCRQFMRKNLPDAMGPLLVTKTCLYDMTLDRTFVIDSLARQGKGQVIICCGAGHAYKWAALFGKILTQLATEGWTSYDISAFTMEREAVRNPNFVPRFHMGLSGSSKL